MKGFSEHRKEPSASGNRFRIDSLKACLGARAVLAELVVQCHVVEEYRGNSQNGWDINRVPVEYGSTVGPPFIVYGMKRSCRLNNMTVVLY